MYRAAMKIPCACGCGTQFEKFDSKNRPRRYVSGHNPQPRNPDLWEKISCAFCGEVFESIKSKHTRFCSRSCKAKHNGRKLSNDPFYRDRQRILILSKGNRPPIHKGSNHWKWKGGITPESKRLRSTEEYKQWRISVFRRDRFKCQHCGVVGANLQAHHIKPWAQHKELRYDVENGTTLCRSCHDAVHGRVTSPV